MRIMTIVRQVPDAEERIRLRDGALDFAGAKLVMDTMDEYGVEEALRLREAHPGTEVVVVAVGAARSEEALRSALAMGADRAVLVETAAPLDALTTSSVVAQLAKSEAADLVLCGSQQADWDSQALGAATAERLGWPHAAWTTALQLQAGQLTGQHDADTGSEAFAMSLPAVITTQQGLNDPRYPTLPNIMKSKKKELRRDPIDSFDSSATQPTLKPLGVTVGERKRMNIMIDAADPEAAAKQIVARLRDEARVIA